MAFTSKLKRNPLPAPPGLDQTPDILDTTTKAPAAEPAPKVEPQSSRDPAPATTAAEPARPAAEKPAGVSRAGARAGKKARRGRPAKAEAFHAFTLRVPNDDNNDLWNRIMDAHERLALGAHSINDFFVRAAEEKLARDKRR